MSPLQDPPSWEEVRRWFPALERWTYLNAASMSPVPVSVHEAMVSFLDRCRDDDVTGEVHLDHAEDLRADIASYLHCGRDEIAFCQSTSDGLLRALDLVDWGRGDNVVAPNASFPSVVLPLKTLESRGVEVRLAGAPESSWVEDEEVLACLDERTRMVCVSWVSFITGHRRNLHLLAEGCRRSGALLYADLMQGAGALRPDMSLLPLDAAAFQSVKWIPSPSGLGVFFARRERVEAVPPGSLGWTSVRRESLEGLARYDRPWWPGARRLDAGSIPPLLAIGFRSALRMLETVGWKRIEDRILALGSDLCKLLIENGFEVITPADPDRRAGILTVAVPKSGAVVAKLREAGVVVADREGRIRVSTHFYNNQDDLHRLMESLSRV